jgi:cell division cycle 14
VYWNFFLDFGPLNFGQLYRFCEILNNKLTDPKLKDKIIYLYSGTHPHRRANAAYLICSWSLLFLGKSPEEAFSPFRGVSPPFPYWVGTFNTLQYNTKYNITT